MSTAVIGAPEFRARNGIVVRPSSNGGIEVGRPGYRDYTPPEATFALEEFFQFKRDEELGRWRWPENPDYVVYPIGDGDEVLASSERSGRSLQVSRRPESFHHRTPRGASDLARAASAYFEAHPETKLPTENGVYVPATADLEGGPLTFVLYDGSWRATAGGDDATELARQWHARNGLVRLGKIEDAS